MSNARDDSPGNLEGERGMTAVHCFNELTEAEAKARLTQCCGASRWVESMLDRRPFASAAELQSAAQHAFAELNEPDWLEAFAHHPRIGDIDSLRKRFAATAAWAGSEQAGASAANEETLRSLARGNDGYFDKHGFIFIVCATGKSAAEMLALLRERLPHSRAEELKLAAGEQQKITALRIDKLLNELAGPA